MWPIKDRDQGREKGREKNRGPKTPAHKHPKRASNKVLQFQNHKPRINENAHSQSTSVKEALEVQYKLT